MTTLEDVERSLGFQQTPHERFYYTSSCTYNPDKDDDVAHDCNMPARWHIRCHSEQGEQKAVTVNACDGHLGRVLGTMYVESVIDRHEFGSACGLEGSWWIPGDDGTTSFCCSTERGLELGYLQYDQG